MIKAAKWRSGEFSGEIKKGKRTFGKGWVGRVEKISKNRADLNMSSSKK